MGLMQGPRPAASASALPGSTQAPPGRKPSWPLQHRHCDHDQQRQRQRQLHCRMRDGKLGPVIVSFILDQITH
ncbi:hypothetical protein PR003_g32699 [Phytophthora rubi]|uniref:Uncharacterized protein n=1 Tax=Phytophthora rubi TaxID=129364 RepID=A0A6A4AZR5_9STRA|nr:hypothetical protein PR002_g32972 [Phytophthora rubi]KAE9264732.1 hypothetical protein PR003_g32699 [Phytophthora rubi]